MLTRKTIEELLDFASIIMEWSSVESYIEQNPKERDGFLENASKYMVEEIGKYKGTDVDIFEAVIFSQRTALRRVYDDVRRKNYLKTRQ